jgi:succinyl-CoA synthetase beta subunit
MKIHEYQAKVLLSRYGIPVPRGKVVAEAAEAGEIAQELGSKVVIKAQVHAGGRGKAGGIKSASSPAGAERAARELLGKRLVTAQTKPEGLPVEKVLVEEAVESKRELYLGIAVGEARRCPVMIASPAGGMDIEDIARQSPQQVLKLHIDPAAGLPPSQGKHMARNLGFDKEMAGPAAALLDSLYQLFSEKDCLLAEINPLAVTAEEKLLALDARITFDDNAIFRQPDIAVWRDSSQEDLREVQASRWGVRNYIKLTGNIGCMVNGAGLAMAVMDLIMLEGGSPANFLDIGTLNTPERVVNAFRIFTQDSEVQALLINIFGGMARVDVIARGIVEAHQQMEVRFPVVIRLAGTNVDEGQRILKESGINYIEAADFADAGRKVVQAANLPPGEVIP